jgi:hypothetical protein
VRGCINNVKGYPRIRWYTIKFFLGISRKVRKVWKFVFGINIRPDAIISGEGYTRGEVPGGSTGSSSVEVDRSIQSVGHWREWRLFNMSELGVGRAFQTG